ncbi:hypothetical protein PLICRDRAFT_178832 [Plicaturopsis crispa FD-325 SS-3]|uniref:Unplaced genomic scaffold PLICRscaffold_15, whole genome shotgun sequence n=1 Tax=Plicaturopsis crispa FD-325 SS-3 TaxID=944288 RepID=A0A0C9T9X0_PLICR|nr:hypothetical protein PLICRDRAFT_178832 [Plicaturopsis crispa FD-325 SS-3]
MAPIATTEKPADDKVTSLKAAINPFYSPSEVGKDGDDYKWAKYKPVFPKIDWEPLKDVEVTERGLLADPSKKNLLGAASKVIHYNPTIGTELHGIDLRHLTDAQKDELALLVAERGAVFFRDQELDIHEQLKLAEHFGPLHYHATTPVPAEPGLEAVHVVYTSGEKRPDPSVFAQVELWHSDVSYEVQPPSITSLKLYHGPPYGGDTLWSSGYALYSSFSPEFQKYLESHSAVHSGVSATDGAIASGIHVRRPAVESVHPLVRVNPATGWKSVYVNFGFTRRIVGVPKAESDAILNFLFRQINENPEFTCRLHWEPNTVAFWDNRVTMHSATHDYWPHGRHALRATPRGEKPLSVAEYEAKYGKAAGDRQLEIWKEKGLDAGPSIKVENSFKTRGYND